MGWKRKLLPAIKHSGAEMNWKGVEESFLDREVVLLHKEQNYITEQVHFQLSTSTSQKESTNELRKEVLLHKETYSETQYSVDNWLTDYYAGSCITLLIWMSIDYLYVVSGAQFWGLTSKRWWEDCCCPWLYCTFGIHDLFPTSAPQMIHVFIRDLDQQPKININGKLLKGESSIISQGEKLQFDYSVYLLNKNIAQLRYQHGLRTQTGRSDLPNLKKTSWSMD